MNSVRLFDFLFKFDVQETDKKAMSQIGHK